MSQQGYIMQKVNGKYPLYGATPSWNQPWHGNRFFLDFYGASIGAWSLRRLRSDYSGNVVRVRRASDNAEQDIGFSADTLDTSALNTFCTGSNCFVTTWYDQAINKNGVQTTAANQPKIYDSSTGVLTRNGKPTIVFDGTDFLNCGKLNGGTKAADFSVMNVSRFAQTGFRAPCGSGGVNVNDTYLCYFTSTVFMDMTAGNTNNGSQFVFARNSVAHGLTQSLNAQYYSSGDNFITYYKNAALQSMGYPLGQSYNQNIGAEGDFFIGRAQTNNTPGVGIFNGDIQETITYGFNIISQRGPAEGDIISFYNIT